MKPSKATERMRKLFSRLLILATIASLFLAHGPLAVTLAQSCQSPSAQAHARASACCCAECCEEMSPSEDCEGQQNCRTVTSAPQDSSPSTPCPDCPLPGGCAYCSVAKVLSNQGTAPTLFSSTFHSFLRATDSSLILPPFVDGLIRPPIV